MSFYLNNLNLNRSYLHQMVQSIHMHQDLHHNNLQLSCTKPHLLLYCGFLDNVCNKQITGLDKEDIA